MVYHRHYIWTCDIGVRVELGSLFHQHLGRYCQWHILFKGYRKLGRIPTQAIFHLLPCLVLTFISEFLSKFLILLD